MRMVLQDAYSKGKSGKGICPHMFRHDSLCASLVMLFHLEGLLGVCSDGGCIPEDGLHLISAEIRESPIQYMHS